MPGPDARQQLTMCSLLTLHPTVNYCIRPMLSPLTIFIVAAERYSDADKVPAAQAVLPFACEPLSFSRDYL
jgi:hypothetical protein